MLQMCLVAIRDRKRTNFGNCRRCCRVNETPSSAYIHEVPPSSNCRRQYSMWQDTCYFSYSIRVWDKYHNYMCICTQSLHELLGAREGILAFELDCLMIFVAFVEVFQNSQSGISIFNMTHRIPMSPVICCIRQRTNYLKIMHVMSRCQKAWCASRDEQKHALDACIGDHPVYKTWRNGHSDSDGALITTGQRSSL